MDFLSLVQALQEESGTSSATISSLAGVTGEALRLKNWVRRANLAIQSKYTNWNFLFVDADVIASTGIGTADYAAPNDINQWDRASFKIDGVRVDESNVLTYTPSEFPDAQSGTPTRVYIMPDKSLRLWPTPASALDVVAAYWKVPVDLSVNADVSLIPAQFHPLIVYEALRYYANWEKAEEIKAQALEGIAEWMPRLEASELPDKQAITRSDGNMIQIIAE